MNSVIVVLPGDVSLEAIAACLEKSFTISGRDPIRLELDGARAYVRLLAEPDDDIFDDDWQNITRPSVASCFAIDYRDQACPVAIVRTLMPDFGGFSVDTDFGFVLPASEFVERFQVERLTWPSDC